MKKLLFALALLCILGLAGCNKVPAEETFSLEDGRYVVENSNEQISVPYILIQNGRFTVVMDIAVSYQPSGKIEKNENEVVMATSYADEELYWTFQLSNDNTLKFLLDKSQIPDGANFIDGASFILVEE